MRRLIVVFSLCFLAALPVVAYAQDVTPQATPPLTDVERVEAAAARAQESAEAARLAASDASNYLGIFESVGTAIGVLTGLLVPALAVVAGFVGLNRLSNATEELAEARKRMEDDIQLLRASFTEELRAKQGELDNLRDELRASAEEERHKSERASLALSLLPLAERQYRVKDLAGALYSYQQALALDPDNMVIHYRLGYVYTQSGQYEDAIRHLNAALKIDPRFAPALANLGYVLRRNAEILDPSDTRRGQLLAESEQKLREALIISPKLVDEDGESWWGILGGLHRRRGQLDDAIEAYNRALDVTPQSSYPLGNLALLYLQKQDRKRMLETYARVEKIANRRAQADNTDFWAWADLLVAQLALGNIVEARETLQAMFAAAPVSTPELLKSPLATLRQLMDVLFPEEAALIQPFIAQIEHRISSTAQMTMEQPSV